MLRGSDKEMLKGGEKWTHRESRGLRKSLQVFEKRKPNDFCLN